MSKVKIVTRGIDKDKIRAAAVKAINEDAVLEIQIKAKRKIWRMMVGKIVERVIEGVVQEVLNQFGLEKIKFNIKFV